MRFEADAFHDTYLESSQDYASDLLFDRLLEDVGECRYHVIAPQLFAELRAKCQEPHTEDHLILQLEATLIAQHCCDAERWTDRTVEVSKEVGHLTPNGVLRGCSS